MGRIESNENDDLCSSSLIQAIKEQTFSTIFESVQEAIIISDHEGTIITSNLRADQVFGFGKNGLIGKNIRLVISSHFLEKSEAFGIQEIDSEFLKQGFKDESAMGYGRDGKVFPVEVRLLFQNYKSETYVLFFIHDISKVVELESDKKFYRCLVDFSIDMFFLIEKDSDLIRNASKCALETLQYTIDECLNIRFSDISDFDLSTICDKIDSSGSNLMVGTFKAKNKATIRCEVVFRTLQKGDRTYYIAIARDITDKECLENQLRQSQKVEAIGRVSAGIAHDFNNKLGTIIMAATSLQLNNDLTETERLVLDLILESAKKSASLTKQLLAFSRKQTLSPISIDVSRTIRKMQFILSNLIADDIKLSFALESDLPLISVDPIHFEQAILNVVLNARDAITDGGEVLVSTFLEKNYRPLNRCAHKHIENTEMLCISIKDTGCGMSEEVRGRIFEPFFTTKPVDQGTGLGLSMVFGFVTQSGGVIEVQSKVNDGTEMKFFFPIVFEETLPEPLETAEQIQRIRLVGNESIIVVEDDVLLCQVTERALCNQQYNVFAFSNPLEALEFFRNTQSNVKAVITDVVMPDMNGVELQSQIRKIDPNIGFVFMTGYVSASYLERIEINLKTQLLLKPFSFCDLVSRVGSVIAGEALSED